MTIDATKPEDSVLVSELPGYIRAGRAEMNSIGVTGTGAVGAVTLDILGATTLTIGTELSEEGYETVVITNTGAACALTNILGGTQGMIKMFVFLDTNVDMTDSNDLADGTFHLNQAPALSDYSPTQYSVLTLVNIGGDGAGTHGYWREVDRASNV